MTSANTPPAFNLRFALPDEKEFLELALLKELGPVEAGSRLGLGKDASYKRYERALQHLRDLIEQHGHPPAHYRKRRE